MTYVLALALFTCVITHTVLYHGRNIWYGMRKVKTEPDDIHAKLMSVYPEVPDWWYLSVFVLFFVVAIILVEVGLKILSYVVSLPTTVASRSGIPLFLCGHWCWHWCFLCCILSHLGSFLQWQHKPSHWIYRRKFFRDCYYLVILWLTWCVYHIFYLDMLFIKSILFSGL